MKKHIILFCVALLCNCIAAAPNAFANSDSLVTKMNELTPPVDPCTKITWGSHVARTTFCPNDPNVTEVCTGQACPDLPSQCCNAFTIDNFTGSNPITDPLKLITGFQVEPVGPNPPNFKVCAVMTFTNTTDDCPDACSGNWPASGVLGEKAYTLCDGLTLKATCNDAGCYINRGHRLQFTVCGARNAQIKVTITLSDGTTCSHTYTLSC